MPEKKSEIDHRRFGAGNRMRGSCETLTSNLESLRQFARHCFFPNSLSYLRVTFKRE
jgi:hypothetical protein